MTISSPTDAVVVDIDDMLRDLRRTAVEALGVDGAGIMSAEDDDKLRFVHASEPLVAVERLQEQLQDGPCRDSAARQETVVVEDVVAASELAGVGAMVATPLLARGRAWGVLDLYRTSTGLWSDHDLAAARLFADVAASYVAMAADRDSAVDQFKKVNDQLGHATGDVVLTEVARRMKTVLRGSDTLARLSADEFVAVCEDLGAADEAGDDVVSEQLEAVVTRIRSALARPVHAAGHEVVVTVSVGAALADGRHRSARELVDTADQAMYRAKHEGWGLVVVKDLESAAVTE